MSAVDLESFVARAIGEQSKMMGLEFLRTISPVVDLTPLLGQLRGTSSNAALAVDASGFKSIVPSDDTGKTKLLVADGEVWIVEIASAQQANNGAAGGLIAPAFRAQTGASPGPLAPYQQNNGAAGARNQTTGNSLAWVGSGYELGLDVNQGTGNVGDVWNVSYVVRRFFV